MNREEIKQLERDLQNDLVHSDEALLSRVREAVKQFLYHEAGKLAGTRVKDERDILQLLELHARVNLLRKVIENPTSFGIKDQKELFKEIRVLKAQAGAGEGTNLLDAINVLDIDPDTKARLLDGAMDLAKENMRRQLKEGTVGHQ